MAKADHYRDTKSLRQPILNNVNAPLTTKTMMAVITTGKMNLALPSMGLSEPFVLRGSNQNCLVFPSHLIRAAAVRRVGKGALAPCPPFFESNVFALNGGHAAGRGRARPLCPPYALCMCWPRHARWPAASRISLAISSGCEMRDR